MGITDAQSVIPACGSPDFSSNRVNPEGSRGTRDRQSDRPYVATRQPVMLYTHHGAEVALKPPG